eukprot:766982-Prymnesium_polylepis.1
MCWRARQASSARPAWPAARPAWRSALPSPAAAARPASPVPTGTTGTPGLTGSRRAPEGRSSAAAAVPAASPYNLA